MTEVLLKQITEITNEIKNIHGDEYGEQYCNVAINLISKNLTNINEYQILIEAAYSLIDSDYKDKLIFNLQKKLNFSYFELFPCTYINSMFIYNP